MSRTLDKHGRSPTQKKYGTILGLAYGGMGAATGTLTPLIFKGIIPEHFGAILALIPIACVWVGLWAHGKLILELDEYLRYTEIKILLFAIVCAIGLATAWGYLEFLGNLPHMPMLFVLPVFYVFYGIGHGLWSRDSFREK